jgi:transcriptional regulator with XRE-family HTH domain
MKGADMALTAGEKIKIIVKRRGTTLSQLAEKLKQSQANLSGKISRDNFSEKELQEIAKALDCTFEAVLTMNDTGERI